MTSTWKGGREGGGEGTFLKNRDIYGCWVWKHMCNTQSSPSVSPACRRDVKGEVLLLSNIPGNTRSLRTLIKLTRFRGTLGERGNRKHTYILPRICRYQTAQHFSFRQHSSCVLQFLVETEKRRGNKLLFLSLPTLPVTRTTFCSIAPSTFVANNHMSKYLPWIFKYYI